MSCSGIQATVNFYTAREADLTHDLTDIMMDITLATKESSKIIAETTNNRAAVKEQYESGTDEYDEAMQAVQDDYNLKLADITAWESELETQKETMETEIQATKSYKDSFTEVLKQNIKTDFKYGQSS